VRRWRALLAPVLAVALCLGYLYQAYLVVYPGPVRDVSSMVEVASCANPEGPGFFLTTVYADRARPDLLWQALWRQDAVVVPRARFTLPGESIESYRRRAHLIMEESQAIATVAAFVCLGHAAAVSGEGALVAHVLPQGPLAGKIGVGETIVAFEGRPIRLADELVAELARYAPGAALSLWVEDTEFRRREITVSIASGYGPEGALGIAVVTRRPGVEGPFEIRVDTNDIGGPSAGLAIALEIVDRLDPFPLTGGRRVAATGVLDASGRVRQVGGIYLKVRAAEREGVELLLVPVANYEEALGAAGRLQVIAVETLSQAVDVLRSMGCRVVPEPGVSCQRPERVSPSCGCNRTATLSPL